MLVAAAVCPCPPLLVPEVAGGAAHEMDAARAACDDALGVLAAARPDRLVVLGPADQAARGTARAGRAGLLPRLRSGSRGQPRQGRRPPDARPLPSSLAVGAWLLTRADWTAAPVEGLGVGEPLSRERCEEIGASTRRDAERVALLVMGDGTNCRTLKAPGYFDERAAAFDAQAARALGRRRPRRTARPGRGVGVRAGRVRPRLLAGARGCRRPAARRRGFSGRLLYDEAPYGVGYLVASWA